MRQSVVSINMEGYQPHWLHTREGVWRQSNCYVDLWVEALHGLSLNPIACLGCTLNIDFEGDQWTFFKMPLVDLSVLYGIDVQELNIWQHLLGHIIEQVRRDRLVLVEVDAFYLPDVADTNYQQEHEKTTIGVQMVDPEERVLGYFHNSGYYLLHGDDFTGIFQERTLPPYVEFAKLDRLKRSSPRELAAQALQLLDTHIAKRPVSNPFIAYSQDFEQQSAAITNLEHFHKYAFATIRQFGASYEYAALYLRWLAEECGVPLQEAADHFLAISETAQVLLLKMARTVKTKKPLTAQPLLQSMQQHWEEGMALVVAARKS